MMHLINDLEILFNLLKKHDPSSDAIKIFGAIITTLKNVNLLTIINDFELILSEIKKLKEFLKSAPKELTDSLSLTDNDGLKSLMEETLK